MPPMAPPDSPDLEADEDPVGLPDCPAVGLPDVPVDEPVEYVVVALTEAVDRVEPPDVWVVLATLPVCAPI